MQHLSIVPCNTSIMLTLRYHMCVLVVITQAMVLRQDREGLAALATAIAAGAGAEDSDLTQPASEHEEEAGAGEVSHLGNAAAQSHKSPHLPPNKRGHLHQTAVNAGSPMTRSAAARTAQYQQSAMDGAARAEGQAPAAALGAGKGKRGRDAAMESAAPEPSPSPAAKRPKQMVATEEGGAAPSVFGAPTQLQPLDMSRMYSQQVAAQEAAQRQQDQAAAAQAAAATKQQAAAAKGKGKGRGKKGGKHKDPDLGGGKDQVQDGGAASAQQEPVVVPPSIAYAPLLVQPQGADRGSTGGHTPAPSAAAAAVQPPNFKAFRKAGQDNHDMALTAVGTIALKPVDYYIKTAEADNLRRYA